VAGGPDGALWFTDGANSVGQVTSGVSATPPAIVTSWPTSGAGGQVVVVHGLEPAGAPAVTFNRVSAVITSEAFSKSKVRLPSGTVTHSGRTHVPDRSLRKTTGHSSEEGADTGPAHRAASTGGPSLTTVRGSRPGR